MKLVLSDIDGTLVHSNEIITPEVTDMVSRLQQNGIQFTIATVRTYDAAQPFVKALDISIPYVINNGATIIHNGTCLYAKSLSIHPIADVLEYADSFGLTVAISDTHNEMPLSINDHVLEQQALGRMTKIFPREQLRDTAKTFQKVMIYDPARGPIIEEIYQRILPNAADYFVTHYPCQAVELAPKGCTKATGLQALSKIMNIAPHEILTCGDAINDIEMLKIAGIGVAVGNATTEVKNVADYVATHHWSAGVVEAVDKLLLCV